MSFLIGQNFTIGGVGIFPSVSVQTPATPDVNQTSQAYFPIEFYYAGKVFHRLSAGLSINNQFGSAASYPTNWEGMYIVQKIALTTFMFQPTLSYKIFDKLSVGAGFIYTLGSFSDTRAVPVSSESTNNGEVTLNGTGHAFGYNIGLFSPIYSHPSDSRCSYGLNIGVDYRSGLSFTVPNGDVSFSQIPASLATEFPASENFSTQVNLPAVLSAAMAFKFSLPKNWDFLVTYEFNYTFWQTYDSLHITFTNPNTPYASEQYNWKNATAHRMGAEVTFKKKYSLRVGYYIDNSPVRNGYVSPEVVDGNSSGLSFGAGYVINNAFSVNIAFIHSNLLWDNTTWTSEGFSASYHRILNIFGIGINYKIAVNSTKANKDIMILPNSTY
jgi:long-chain fatty acid transport protein